MNGQVDKGTLEKAEEAIKAEEERIDRDIQQRVQLYNNYILLVARRY